MNLEKGNKIELNLQKEKIDFVQIISNNILDTFPFSEEERTEFKIRINDIENNLSQITDNEELVQKLKEAVASIDNTHASLQEV